MDDDLGTFGADEHDDLEKIARGVGSEDQSSVGILAEIVDGERELDRMEHVLGSYPMAGR